MAAVKPSWMYNWAEFQAKVTHTFDPTNRKKEAAKQLSTLKQTKSAAEYYTRFLKYSVDAGFNEESMVFTFHKGLKPKIKDALSTRAYKPDTLVDLAKLCIRLDQCLYKRWKEGRLITEVQTEHTVKTTHEPCQNLPCQSSTAAVTTRAYSTPPAPNPFRRPVGLYTSLSTSQSPRAGPLSQEERQKRLESWACLVCGDKGHLAANCPKSRFNNYQNRPAINTMAICPTGKDKAPAPHP